jgi:hypothetical protein
MTSAEFLRERLEAVYRAFMPAMTTDRGHCHEVAQAGQVLAQMAGVNVVLCSGWRKLPGNITDAHSWLELGSGRVLHSPARGRIELRTAEPGEFTSSLRIGE